RDRVPRALPPAEHRPARDGRPHERDVRARAALPRAPGDRPGADHRRPRDRRGYRQPAPPGQQPLRRHRDLPHAAPRQARSRFGDAAGVSRAVWLTLIGGFVEVVAGVTLGILGFMAFRLEFYRSGAGNLGPMFGPGTLMYLSFFASLRGLLA